jgi:hypothetical protein
MTDIIVPRLEGYRTRIEFSFVLKVCESPSLELTQRNTYMDDNFLPRLSKDHTSLSPREIIHFPERVEWQEERECRDCKDVEDHPANHIPLPSHDKDQSLHTINGRYHD